MQRLLNQAVWDDGGVSSWVAHCSSNPAGRAPATRVAAHDRASLAPAGRTATRSELGTASTKITAAHDWCSTTSPPSTSRTRRPRVPTRSWGRHLLLPRKPKRSDRSGLSISVRRFNQPSNLVVLGPLRPDATRCRSRTALSAKPQRRDLHRNPVVRGGGEGGQVGMRRLVPVAGGDLDGAEPVLLREDQIAFKGKVATESMNPICIRYLSLRQEALIGSAVARHRRPTRRTETAPPRPALTALICSGSAVRSRPVWRARAGVGRWRLHDGELRQQEGIGARSRGSPHPMDHPSLPYAAL